MVRQGVEHEPDVAAERDLARGFGGQEEGHIDIGQIHHVEYTAPGVQHFARFGNAVLHTAVARRFEYAVVNVRLQARDRRLGGLDQRLRFHHLGFRRLDACTAPPQPGPAPH